MIMDENTWHFAVTSFLHNRNRTSYYYPAINFPPNNPSCSLRRLAFVRIEDLAGRCPFANVAGRIT